MLLVFFFEGLCCAGKLLYLDTQKEFVLAGRGLSIRLLDEGVPGDTDLSDSGEVLEVKFYGFAWGQC